MTQVSTRNLQSSDPSAGRDIRRGSREDNRGFEKEGFGILSTIDPKSTLKEKLDKDFQPYVILGACNPSLAKQALDAELELGVLLPCNVVVYADESGTGSVVSAVDPHAMLGVVRNPDLTPIADDVQERLTRALESL